MMYGFGVLLFGILLTSSRVEPVVSEIASADFEVKVDKSGSYSVQVNKQEWLGSGATSFHFDKKHHSTADGTLKLISPKFTRTGVDTFGQWSSSGFMYGAPFSSTSTSVSVKTYKDVNVAVFSQEYMTGAKDTTMGNKDGVISSFPTFSLGSSNVDLGYLTFFGVFIGHEQFNVGRVKDMKPLGSGLETGPLVLFDQSDNVIIISSFNHFMAASYQYNKDKTVSYGIMGDVDVVPAGYHLDTLVFYSNEGINKAFEEWGALMMKWYNRDSSARYLDPTVNYLGFWTDNGAYYYHLTEPNMTYEKTILLQNLYAQSQGIPYRYLQLDDWFYPIAGTGYGATVTWDAMPSIFPHGLQSVYNTTRMPIHAHNRYWSNKTTYATQNGGNFKFLMDGENSIPDDQSFWDYLFQTSKEWGLVVYEQDWLNYQLKHITWLHSDLTLAERWLKQMGRAAYNNGIFIQYCMALPRELLATLEIPSVSQIRVSIDYLLNDSQWKIGVTSLFSYVLGIAPFKDNFWTQSVQPGNTYNKTEVNPAREAAVAILSTGPVGPSDRIGYSDVELIRQLHTESGLLLKPSKPATAIDSQILQQAFGGAIGPMGEVWTTYSDVGPFRFGIIFASELNDSYTIGPSQAKFGPKWSGDNVVYATERTKGTVTTGGYFSTSTPLSLSNCEGANLCLHYTAPVFDLKGSLVFLAGELTKFVPVSPQRISTLSVSTVDVVFAVKGSPGEVVNQTFCSVKQPTDCITITCIISETGVNTLRLAGRLCL